MQEPSGGKDEVAFRVSSRESFLSLHMTGMDGDDAGIFFQRIRDQFGISERCIWVKKMV